MALIGNGSVLNNSAGKWLSGGSGAHASGRGQNPAANRSNWNRNSEWAKFGLQDRSGEGVTGDVVRLAAVPDGYYFPASWALPVRAGAMKALYTADFGMTSSGTALAGLPATGTAEFGFTTTATGGLIVSGTCSASFGISTNTPLLTASVNGTGSATFGISTNTPTLGAVASITGSASFGLSAGGTLTGIGHMTGSTADSGVTVDNVVAGVWNAVLTDYNNAGSAGLALATASSGGVDYTAMGLAVWTSVSRTLTSTAPPTTADIVAAIEAAIVSVNVKQVNDVAVTGTGATGDEWGPA